jgi:hypothetical protein
MKSSDLQFVKALHDESEWSTDSSLQQPAKAYPSIAITLSVIAMLCSK